MMHLHETADKTEWKWFNRIFCYFAIIVDGFYVMDDVWVHLWLLLSTVHPCKQCNVVRVKQGQAMKSILFSLFIGF